MLLDGTSPEIVERDDGFISAGMLEYFAPLLRGHSGALAQAIELRFEATSKLLFVDLPTLLELLYSASERSRTIHATVRRVSRPAREAQLLRVRGLHRELPPIPPEEGAWGTPSEEIEATTQLWWARPDWLRWETSFSRDSKTYQTFVGVKQGEVFWGRFGDRDEIQTNEGRRSHGPMTTDEERLLNPVALLGAFRFTLRQPTEQLGRTAIKVDAMRRTDSDFHSFGPLAEHLSLIVDVERGILLRAALVVEEEEISTSEITAIGFDEPISPERFEPLR